MLPLIKLMEITGTTFEDVAREVGLSGGYVHKVVKNGRRVKNERKRRLLHVYMQKLHKRAVRQAQKNLDELRAMLPGNDIDN